MNNPAKNEQNMYEVVTFIKSLEVCHVETLRVQNLWLIMFAATSLFIHRISLTTDQGACEAVICISIGTMDYIKSKTNSLNLNQRIGLSF